MPTCKLWSLALPIFSHDAELATGLPRRAESTTLPVSFNPANILRLVAQQWQPVCSLNVLLLLRPFSAFVGRSSVVVAGIEMPTPCTLKP